MKKPVVRVLGQTGSDLIPKWGAKLQSVTYTDNEGGEADEIEIVFNVSPPFPRPPAKGTRYILEYGWNSQTLRNAGVFTFQSASLNKPAGDAWTMAIIARSADFVDADKTADTSHFEETTAGEIFQKLAKEAGKTAVVDSDVGAISIPYRLRYGQSALGFGQALADEIGGSLKLAGGKWIVTAKGASKTASGKAMPPIVIPIEQIMDAGISTEGRADTKEIEAGYFDADAGRWVSEKAAGKGKSSRSSVLHPSASPGEAKARGKAEATDLARATISGSLTVEGDVDAMAGAPLVLPGFGEWAGDDLTAGAISHSFTFDESGGWLMTVEIAAKGG